jgi:hypothetical protein
MSSATGRRGRVVAGRRKGSGCPGGGRSAAARRVDDSCADGGAHPAGVDGGSWVVVSFN